MNIFRDKTGEQKFWHTISKVHIQLKIKRKLLSPDKQDTSILIEENKLGYFDQCSTHKSQS